MAGFGRGNPARTAHFIATKAAIACRPVVQKGCSMPDRRWAPALVPRGSERVEDTADNLARPTP
jgi:hypothetical protein